MNLHRLISESGKLIIPDHPLMFFLDLTQRCNLRCWFCYNDENREYIDADFEKIKRILNEMKNSGCQEVIYLGGEPTIYKYFWETIDYANYLGYFQCFVSNGQIIDEKFVERLKKYENIEVGISIHSSRENVQNAIANSPIAYNRIVKAIKCLEKYEIKWYSQTSLIKENYLEIEKLHKFLKEIGNPSRMDLSRMVEGKIKSSNFLNEDEYIQVFVQICRLDTKILPVRIEAFPRCWLKKIAHERSLDYNKIKNSVRPCYAWIGQVSIDIFGNVRMCPTGGAVAGNILETGIDNLWKNSVEINKFQNFNWQREECCECDEFPFCVGACKMTCHNQYPAPDKYIVKGGMSNAGKN